MNDAWLDWPSLSRDYARYHATKGNQRCHVIGIPLIVFALLAWTSGFIAVFLPVYYLWNRKIGIGMTVSLAALGFFAIMAPAGSAWVAFIVGWAFQLAGHKFYEGKSPAFADNLIHLLVGPAWILQKFVKV